MLVLIFNATNVTSTMYEPVLFVTIAIRQVRSPVSNKRSKMVGGHVMSVDQLRDKCTKLNRGTINNIGRN